jgi:hypothetical protein
LDFPFNPVNCDTFTIVGIALQVIRNAIRKPARVSDHEGMKKETRLFENSIPEKIQRFKDSKIQRFKDSKIQRFKDSKIQRFKDSKIQRFKDWVSKNMKL